MKIKVLKKDIVRAAKIRAKNESEWLNGGDIAAHSCPIAQALKSKFKTNRIEVGGADEIEIRCEEYQARQYKKVASFIRRFDITGKGSPFEFDIERRN